MPLSSELLSPVAGYLEAHEDAQRIQKLIFCLCKKYWENDPNVLQSFSFEQLLLELVQLKPTIEQLTFSLYKLVKTLNRPKVYAAIAKVILDQLSPIYQNENNQKNAENEQSNIIALKKVPTEKEVQQEVDQNFLAEQIANKLSQHPESPRMIKLIYAACRDSWENDPEVIRRHSVKNLITELRNIYPTKSEVECVFNQLVANINKQTLYLAIANLVLSQMDCLYENFDESVNGNNHQHGQALKTQILQTPTVFSLTKVQHRQDTQTSIIDINTEPVETILKSSAQSAKCLPELPKAYNLFDLRLEIMQYTNPLRTKILLFSVLFHNWDKQGKDWTMLRGYSLDDLIQQIILTGKPLAEIETKLYAQAKTFSEKEAYIQTAGTIIQALKSIF